MEEIKPRNMVGRIKQIDECCGVHSIEWQSCFLRMLKEVFGLIDYNYRIQESSLNIIATRKSNGL
jgi:hypothetical protein